MFCPHFSSDMYSTTHEEKQWFTDIYDVRYDYSFFVGLVSKFAVGGVNYDGWAMGG